MTLTGGTGTAVITRLVGHVIILWTLNQFSVSVLPTSNTDITAVYDEDKYDKH